jgi:octaprenyl-diphosphate synthase
VQIDFLKQAVGDDMAAVDRVLRAALDSDVMLVRSVADYVIGSGGKRLRPALLLLVARACGYCGNHHHTLAAVVEMIHTSTLLHDDVVDESAQRRGRPTANTEFGNAASVLVGDFLYSRSFQLMVSVESMRVLQILADATNVIAAGEVQQLMNTGDVNLDEPAYIKVIQRKTAKLFEAASQLGALLAGVDETREAAFARYGMRLGTAFQIMDDLLDYTGDAAAIGKNLGDDLAEGKMTLPLIRAMAVGSGEDKGVVRRAIEHASEGSGLADFAPLVEVLKRTDALTYTQMRARSEAIEAAACLGAEAASPDKETLIQLCSFAAGRSF